MARVVTVQWFNRGVLILLAAALASAGSLSIQEAKTQTFPEEMPIEVLFLSLQIDFICSSNYTGVDRIGESVPLMNIFNQVEAGTFEGPSFFDSPCRSYETGRISLSLNPQLFLRNLAVYGGGSDSVQRR